MLGAMSPCRVRCCTSSHCANVWQPRWLLANHSSNRRPRRARLSALVFTSQAQTHSGCMTVDGMQAHHMHSWRGHRMRRSPVWCWKRKACYLLSTFISTTCDRRNGSPIAMRRACCSTREPRHMQHQIRRWDRDHSAGLHSAWMNRSGVMV